MDEDQEGVAVVVEAAALLEAEDVARGSERRGRGDKRRSPAPTQRSAPQEEQPPKVEPRE